MKFQYHPILFAALISSFGESQVIKNSIGRTQATATDEGEETSVHEGCKLLLNDREEPNEMLVGAAYEATMYSDYLVADEAGPTAATCNNGFAGGYPCNNVNLSSMIGLSGLKSGGSSMANDIWGWTDSTSLREFAIIGLKEGTSFVEITDEFNPVFVGFLPTKTVNSSWRDIKTIGNYALIVSEAGDHGMQVFDLNQLLNAQGGSTFSEDVHYDDFKNAHNIFVNEDTEYAYAVGTNTCNGGLHVIAMIDPLNPVFAGCYSSDGYTHDVQCVLYNGPDASNNGKEICFASNEDTITIIDVTDKTNMVQLARESYSGDRYTHQGWLTEDHTHFLFNDELDEYRGVTSKTRTHVFKVTELNNPVYAGYHDGRTTAIDHNLYVHGDYVYQANYRAGLNVLKIANIGSLQFEEVGYFDIYPTSDASNFNGAWSNYPYFPSGKVVVSGIEQGLFVLRVGNLEPTSAPVEPTSAPVEPTSAPVEPTSAPVEPTSAPVEPTSAPVEPTPAPVEPTSAPVEPISAPVPTTPAPTPEPTWGIDRVDQRDLPLDTVYNVPGDGAGVTAYIIDTGIRTSHDEFKKASDSSETRAIWGTNTSGDNDDSDCHGHGTHVAGTVGGLLYGVAKQVDLVAVKVLDCNGGGTLSGVIDGIEWVMEHAADNPGKKATANLSLGSSESPTVNAAVKTLHESGVVTVVAAGNADSDACDFSPAMEEAVITVGSTDRSDARSSFSNYGNCLDIFAPGRDITSAWKDSDSQTNTISGTSMASPHVCGGAALLLASGLDESTTEAVLLGSATLDKVTDAKIDSPNKLLYVGEIGPTNSPTPAPPTPAPTLCQTDSIEVEVLTDDYPAETSWVIKNTCGENDVVVGSGGGYTGKNTSYSDSVCAPPAKYTFVISDTYGDGICCGYGEGSYIVEYKGDKFEGSQFQSVASHTFGSCNLEPTSAPVEPTSAPVEPTSAPVEPTSAPVEPTSAPVEPTSAPVEPTSSPTIDQFVPFYKAEFTNNAGDFTPDTRWRETGGFEDGGALRIRKKQKVKTWVRNINAYSRLKIEFMFKASDEVEEGNGLKVITKFNRGVKSTKWKKTFGAENNDNTFLNLDEWYVETFIVDKPSNGKKLFIQFAGLANNSGQGDYMVDNVIVSSLLYPE